MYRLCELANEAFGRSCMKWEGLAVDRLVLTRLPLRMRQDGHELVLVARESSGTSLVYDVRLGGASGRAIGRIYRVPITARSSLVLGTRGGYLARINSKRLRAHPRRCHGCIQARLARRVTDRSDRHSNNFGRSQGTSA